MENKASLKELRLIKKSKKGILKVIFGRTGISVIFVLAQMYFYLNMFHVVRMYFPFLFSANLFLQVIFILYLLQKGESSSVLTTWLILTAIAPFYSIPMYFFIKNDIGHRKLKKATIEYIDKSKNQICQNPSVLEELVSENKKLHNLAKYINKTGCYPIYKNTALAYYSVGDEMFPEMLEAIKKAKKYIFLEFFIIDEGYMWGSILKLLSEKVKEGVEVRVLYDGMCEFSLLPHSYPEQLKKLGIQARIFSKILPFVSTSYNFRDHRKLLLIDGEVAFTGGVNLADEYINKITRFGHWKDAGIRLEGEAVKSCLLLFLQTWYLSMDGKERRLLQKKNKRSKKEGFLYECRKYLGESLVSQKTMDGYVIPYGDHPLDQENVGEMVYLDILNRAEKYVYIMTPYLIIDEAMQTALTHAAKKGVDIRIITPHRPDKKLVFANTRGYYKTLLRAGVSVYEYEPGFLHSKVFLSDDKRAVVGSINLDYRSLYHNFENAVYVESIEFAKEVKRDFDTTFPNSIQVDFAFLKNDSFLTKIIGIIVKPFSYLM